MEESGWKNAGGRVRCVKERVEESGWKRAGGRERCGKSGVKKGGVEESRVEKTG